MFTVFRPVPSRQGHAGVPGLKRRLQPVQVGPVPGHEEQVVLAPSQWHAMSAGGILKNIAYRSAQWPAYCPTRVGIF